MLEWFLSLFSAHRELRYRSDVQAKALETEIAHSLQLESALSAIQSDLQVERAHRVSAEAISSERGVEIQRLLADVADSRQTERSIRDERLKSLDTLNLKLMESRVEAPPPDLAQFHAAAKLKTQLVDGIRKRDREMDMLLLQKYYPQFKNPANVAEIPAPQSSPTAEGG